MTRKKKPTNQSNTRIYVRIRRLDKIKTKLKQKGLPI